MKLERTESNGAILQLSRPELVILNNALNEICNGLDLGDEFSMRIGAETIEVEGLLAEIGQAIDILDSTK